MARKTEATYGSADGRTRIHAVEWRPEKTKICAVLQIVHGMQEYIERYEEFATYLTDRGFLVVGHDHLGHGKSIVSKEDYGYFAEKDGNGVLLADMRKLQQRVRKKYPDVPYYMLGHSMGSFLLRQYLCRWGDDLDGAIIMGTGTQPPAALCFGMNLTRVLAKAKGWRHRVRLVDRIAFGSYNNHLKQVRTTKDWLTKDEEIVERYLADERCRFIFTLNGFYNLFYSIGEAGKRENMEKMPKDLPILFASGDQDPVGACGRGVKQAEKAFQAVGMIDVTCLLYADDRHEILNETNRQAVMRDLYAWLYVHLQEPRHEERKQRDV